MNVPFTSEQFFNIFMQYNQYVWPIQILLYLAGLWLWMGMVYHLTFFTTINKVAYRVAYL